MHVASREPGKGSDKKILNSIFLSFFFFLAELHVDFERLRGRRGNGGPAQPMGYQQGRTVGLTTRNRACSAPSANQINGQPEGAFWAQPR